MQNNTKRISVDLAPIAARAMAFLNPSAVERFYSLSPAKYFSEAMRGKGKSSIALSAGCVEQQIVSTHALGILRAAEDVTVDALLRAVDRKTYDLTHAAIKNTDGNKEIQLKICVPFLDETADETACRTALAIIQITKAGRQIVRDECFSVITNWLSSQSNVDSVRQVKPSDGQKKSLRQHLGDMPIRGFIDLYDRCDMEELDEFALIYDGAGIDVTDYTSGIRVTAEDAAIILSATPEDTALNAASLMVARAIQKDKAFCIDKILQSDSGALEAARIEKEKAEQRAAAAEKRIAELEAVILHHEKDAQKASAALQAHEADAQELAALRDALWRSAQGAEAPDQDKQTRTLPDGVVIVGGHPAWARRVVEQFPTVRAYPHGTTCPEAVIRSASELWIQAAFMSHSEFYAAIDIARACGIPVRYFSGTGLTTTTKNLLDHN